ncbi:MAG: LytR C-terminal domain-containing protein [Actinobacteria bacterium]|nr:LytR C-terminal domain-containing protein [Actinomycetota bacterium]
MTPELPPPPASGDEIDFSALVAEHNQSTVAQSAESSEAGSPSRWWRIGYPVLVGAFVLVVVPLLVFAGLRVILDSSDGKLIKRVTDPAAPGYEAVVEKTPTALAAVVATDGSLDSVIVFALSSDTSGGVLLIPGSLGVETTFGLFPLTTLWKLGELDPVATEVGKTLNLSFTESFVIAASDWTTLVGPYAPLTLSIPDAVRDAKDAIVFPKGSVTLKSDQIATFLTSRSAKDVDLNLLIRQELFWKAWLSKVKSSSLSFPTPTTSGLGRFVAAVARGQLSISSLPVVLGPIAPAALGGAQTYVVKESAALASVAAIVPFPDGASGRRPRIRVLDGTGKLSNGINAAIMLNAAGGQVDVVGNAKSYGQATTQIIYFEGTTEAEAKTMQKALTMGTIVASKQSNSGADMTVILGEDFVAKFGPSSSGGVSSTSSTTTTLAPSTTTARK